MMTRQEMENVRDALNKAIFALSDRIKELTEDKTRLVNTAAYIDMKLLMAEEEEKNG